MRLAEFQDPDLFTGRTVHGMCLINDKKSSEEVCRLDFRTKFVDGQGRRVFIRIGTCYVLIFVKPTEKSFEEGVTRFGFLNQIG